ncbi:MAG: DNA gyrase modulator, partial [bacterium]
MAQETFRFMDHKDADSAATLLTGHFGLDSRQLETTLAGALARRADFADLYFEIREVTHIGLEEGLVKRANASVAKGVGVRVLAGEKTGFAYSDEVSLDSLQLAAKSARTIADGTDEERRVRVGSRPDAPKHDLYPIPQSGITRPLPDRIALLEKIDRVARSFDSRITNVMANVAIEEKQVVVANSEGDLVADTQPLVRVNVTCIAEEKGVRET